ncbi:tail terminator protein [Caudoviricetes sp.]|nr:tail terminator protein [Caudoviricetes sp.]
MISYLAGYDEIMSHAKTAYETAVTAVLGSIPDNGPRFENVERPNKPGNTYWARISAETANQDRLIVGQIDNTGKSRYRNRGFLLIEVFGPKTEIGVVGKVREICSRMRDLTVSATTPNGVYFEGVRVEDSQKTNIEFVSLALWAEWTFDEQL